MFHSFKEASDQCNPPPPNRKRKIGTQIANCVTCPLCNICTRTFTNAGSLGRVSWQDLGTGSMRGSFIYKFSAQDLQQSHRKSFDLARSVRSISERILCCIYERILCVLKLSAQDLQNSHCAATRAIRCLKSAKGSLSMFEVRAVPQREHPPTAIQRRPTQSPQREDIDVQNLHRATARAPTHAKSANSPLPEFARHHGESASLEDTKFAHALCTNLHVEMHMNISQKSFCASLRTRNGRPKESIPTQNQKNEQTKTNKKKEQQPKQKQNKERKKEIQK